MPVAWQGFDQGLTGRMLLQVGDLVGLTRLDLSSNRLEALPTALTQLTRLQVRGVTYTKGWWRLLHRPLFTPCLPHGVMHVRPLLLPHSLTLVHPLLWS